MVAVRKLILLLIVLPLAVTGFLFGGLNSAEVSFHWLFGTTRLPLVLLLAGTLVFGVVLGVVLDQLLVRIIRQRGARRLHKP